MRALILPLLLLFLASCSDNAGVSRKLSGSDSMVINFNLPQSDSISSSVTTTEKKAINRFSEFISAKETEEFKCGYDGNIIFFEKGKRISDVVFKYSDAACRHFLLDVDGKLTSTRLSNEAADMLKSLAEGRSWY